MVNEELSVGDSVTVELLINAGKSSTRKTPFNETLSIIASNPD